MNNIWKKITAFGPQYGFALLIIGTCIGSFTYARDFMAGRLSRGWLFLEITNKDVRLFTLLIIIGIGGGFLVSKLFEKLKVQGTKATQQALQERTRFIKFGIVGGMGALWQLVLLYAFVSSGLMSKYIAVLPIFFVIGLHNYILNDLWTFQGFSKTKRSLVKYYAVNAISGGIYFAVYYILITLGIHYIIASTLGIGTAALANFAGSRLGIWKPV